MNSWKIGGGKGRAGAGKQASRAGRQGDVTIAASSCHTQPHLRQGAKLYTYSGIGGAGRLDGGICIGHCGDADGQEG